MPVCSRMRLLFTKLHRLLARRHTHATLRALEVVEREREREQERERERERERECAHTQTYLYTRTHYRRDDNSSHAVPMAPCDAHVPAAAVRNGTAGAYHRRARPCRGAAAD